MILALTFLSVVYGQVLLKFDEMMSPVDISWPTAWVSAIATPSSNHIGTATVTVSCKVPIDLESDAYAVLSIPGFTDATDTLGAASNADEDISFTFTCSFDTADTYGPISLVIRQSVNGQILAASNNIGSIAIIGEEPTSTDSLTVSFVTASRAISDDATLKFQFTLGASERLERYDYFVLYLDDSFDFSDGEIIWDSTADDYELFCNMTIDTSSSGIITIYGLLNEVHAAATVVFSISGFSNPITSRSASTYSWEIEVWRFGTPTLIKIVEGSGPADAIDPGTMSDGQWSLVNNYVSGIYVGLTAFTKLSFKPGNDIPVTGSVVITFATGSTINAKAYTSSSKQALTTVDDSNPAYIWAETSQSGASLTCTVGSATEATCTVAGATIAGGQTITVYNLVTFTATTSVSTIVSKFTVSQESALKTIDSYSASTATTKTLCTTCTDLYTDVVAYFSQVGASSETVKSEAGSSDSFGLVVSVKAPTTLTASADSIVISFPFLKADSADLTNIDMGSSCALAKSSTVNAIYGGNNYATGSALTDGLDCGSASLSYTFQTDVTGSTYFTYYFTSAAAGTKVYFPYTPIQKKSMKELVVKVVHGTTMNYYRSVPLYLSKNTNLSPVFTPFCPEYAIPGLPATIGFTPPYTFSETGYSLKVNFAFSHTDASAVTNNLGSGLTSGATYPSSNNDLTFTLGTKSVSYTTTTFASLSPVSAKIPFPSMVTGTYTITASIILIGGSEDLEIALDSETLDATVGAPEAVSTVDGIFSQSATYETTIDTTGYDNQVDDQNTANVDESKTVDDDWNIRVAFATTPGYEFGSTNSVDGESITFSTFTSTDSSFTYNVGYKDSTPVTDEAAAAAISFTAISPWFDDTSATAYFAYGLTGTAACKAAKSWSTDLTAGTLTNPVYAPQTANAFTFDSPRSDISLTLSYAATIYAGDKVTVAYSSDKFTLDADSDWNIRVGSEDLACTYASGTCTSDVLTADQAAGNIVITITGLIKPYIGSGDTETTTPFTAVSVLHGTYNIYTWSSTGVLLMSTTFTHQAYASVFSELTEVSVFPDTAGAELVYFFISFKPNVDLPVGTIITISGETFEDDAELTKDNTWCNYGFSSAEVDSGNLIITTNVEIGADDEISIIKDLAFTLGAKGTSSVFKIFADYTYNDHEYPLVDDTSVTTDHTYEILEAPTATASGFTVEPEITNMGFDCAYYFNFTISVATEAEWSYCFDASSEYNSHPGETVTFEGFETTHFLLAWSDLYQDVYCTTDHWLVCCSGLPSVEANTEISIGMFLANPSEASATWNLYVVDSDMNLVVDPEYDGDVTFTDIPANSVNAYFASLDYVDEFHLVSDLILETYISASFDASTYIYVNFPYPFNLDVDNPVAIEGYAHYDEDDDATDFATGPFVTSMNIVEIPIVAAKDFDDSYWTTFTFNNIVIPDHSLSRTPYEPEEIDIYEKWTGKFDFMIIESLNNDGSCTVSGQSYAHLNAAYTGFTPEDYLNIIVNGGDSIIIKPGAYSNLFEINVEGDFEANSVTLTPSSVTDNTLYFDSVDYYLDSLYPWDYFSVGASSDTYEGYYYIQWDIKEDPFVSGDNQYRPPKKTKVQVYLGDPYTIILEKDLVVPANYYSFPFGIALPFVTPFSGISIEFIPDEYENITIEFEPSTVVFEAGDYLAYFSIYCENCVDGQEYTFTYSLTGDDAGTFEIDPDGSFTVGNYADAPAVASVYLNIISSTEADVTIKTDTDAVVCWALLSQSLYDTMPELWSQDGIEANAMPLIYNETSDSLSLDEQISQYILEVSDLDQDGYTWDQFSRAVLLYAEFTYFADIQFVSATTEEYSLNTFGVLAAQTNYIVAAYVDNFSGSDPVFVSASGTTDNLPAPARITVSYDSTAALDLTKINSSFCSSYKADCRRFKSTQKATRMLAGYESTTTFEPSALSAASPSEVAKANSGALESSLTAAGFTVLSISDPVDLTADDYDTPGFENEVWEDDEVSFVTVDFAVTSDGIVCCQYEFEGNGTITSYDVILGISSEGEDVSDNNVCELTIAGQNFTYSHNFTTDEEYGDYTFYCAVCNDYPVVPECSEQLLSYTFTWTNETSSYASILAFAALIAYLV
ncbi:hypothetical protein SteCoe_9905 [Stentor coeruleus]|uniref:Uncharacterized protein n=1 Tax=Stentor coeruleus TaxID=5963 RepID=A0A1R2CGM0_9CILI|nr:hypothetical protein SteCoe_9905 [Stentor coeruleus]